MALILSINEAEKTIVDHEQGDEPGTLGLGLGEGEMPDTEIKYNKSKYLTDPGSLL